MRCFQCENRMSYEMFFDQQRNFWGWKCLFYGEIADEVILEIRVFFRRYEMICLREKNIRWR